MLTVGRLALAAGFVVLWLASAGAGAQTASALPVAITHVGDTPQYNAIVPAARPLAQPAPAGIVLGKQLFMDTRLSQPKGTSCASCHDPATGFTSFNGGRDGVAAGSLRARLGTRNPPALTYARYVPPLYFYQDDDAQVPSPFGGLMLDGRADDFAAQVKEPLLAPHEMNLRTPSAVAARLRSTGYTAAFEAQFGTGVLNDPSRALKAFGQTLQAYLRSDELSPFDSRFDELLQGKPSLTRQELKGLAIFRNPDQGNCASCHSVSITSSNPARSLFTDFGYEALGVPRNMKLPSTARATDFDLGLCKTAEQRHWPEAEVWCGYFRTPSLRNVAVRTQFMHNGVFDNLRDAVRFYATRSTQPADWYGHDVMFNDLPAAMRGNVNIVSTPLNRKAGSTPAMNGDDIDAVVAFLKTLTDRRYVVEALPRNTSSGPSSTAP
ncbi:MAG: putative Cytochrome-c peroxidase [Rhizobacter sp.]|nr:putative Cytochrome-c peroxidase [Rhizobacter sp.]